MPLLSTSVRELEPRPALIIRSRIARSDIAKTLGQSLGRIVKYAGTAGAQIAGMPFARYPEFGEGVLTMEAGMPLRAAAAGSGDIESFTLPAGRTAVAVHQGPYDQLPQSFGAFERWMKEQGLVQNGAPWESYVTDPGQEPDSAKWITEIYWPVR
jgi:AraC family transcriptional regulator